MKKLIRNLSILFLPFIFMIIVNEYVRPSIKEKQYSAFGVKAICSNEKISNKCTWYCQNNTAYCKSYHVKFMKPYYSISDKYYFGTIKSLAATGNYAAANIIILMLIFPLLFWVLIIKTLNLEDKIKTIKTIINANDN